MTMKGIGRFSLKLAFLAILAVGVSGALACMLKPVPVAAQSTHHKEADSTGQGNEDGERFLRAVQTFADQVIEHGRDRYGDEDTPLFVNHLNVDTLEAAEKRSNFGTQQNLMRTLVGLTELTGDTRYRQAAEEATRHMIEHHRSPSGLFYWGGYVFIDLESGEYQGPRNDEHSLRGHFPFYEFLWEVDPGATEQFIRSFWNSHVLDWRSLETCRRGGADPNWDREMGDLWESEFDEPGPFIRTQRTLTFIHSGTDMVYAAAFLHQTTGEEGAWTWGERLAERYVKARHPETGLGAVQYNILEATRPLPEEGDLPTLTHYGDRAKNQFSDSGSSDPDSDDYNPIKGKMADDGMPVAREPWKLFSYGPNQIYQSSAQVKLYLAEQLGEDGEQLLEWTLDGLKAYAEYAYVHEEDRFRPMWADGTDLTGLRKPISGYYGSAGSAYDPRMNHNALLLSYARAWRLSGNEQLWAVTRSLAEGLGLGDLGEEPGQMDGGPWQTDHADPRALLAVLEIARVVEDGQAYIALAERMGDNMLEQCVRNGLFVGSLDTEVARTDSMEAQALLALEAARSGRWDEIPAVLLIRGQVLLG